MGDWSSHQKANASLHRVGPQGRSPLTASRSACVRALLRAIRPGHIPETVMSALAALNCASVAARITSARELIAKARRHLRLAEETHDIELRRRMLRLARFYARRAATMHQVAAGDAKLDRMPVAHRYARSGAGWAAVIELAGFPGARLWSGAFRYGKRQSAQRAAKRVREIRFARWPA